MPAACNETWCRSTSSFLLSNQWYQVKERGSISDQADTVELSDEVQETFLLHNRLFQRYAIDNNTYFVPVDEVRGIDITPHHHNPEEGLENLYLDIDNLNMPFQFSSNHFDLVNSRLVAGGINTGRWTGYIRDIFRSLRPGGWVQMVEIDFNAQSDNGALADNSALRQWSQTYLFAMEQCKNPRAPRRLGGWLRNAGFTDVDERMIPLPMCAWSDNQRDYDIGAANQENVRMLLSSVAIYPFTHYLRYAPSKDMLGRINGNVDGHSSMSITEFHVLVAKARTEAANPALKV
ncbi:S-adenosyl-L-methionine-dependent methyltransferase [Xylaria longipes]|nr:S-adenosyl-L-methionine-dependent methyltransferase [Xylaria longipes]